MSSSEENHLSIDKDGMDYTISTVNIGKMSTPLILGLSDWGPSVSNIHRLDSELKS